MLDIELPDLSGHALATLFRQTDPDGFISMVTSNNYLKDVEQARENNVQGFVVKPYTKQKILDVVAQYSKFSKSTRAS